jgi:GTP 3',8-cyclase
MGCFAERVRMREPTLDEVIIGSSPKRYICEIHRELYDAIDNSELNGNKEACLNLVAEAYWAGKRISERLNELKEGWQKSEDVEDNKDYLDDLARRATRMNLLKNIKSINIETIDYCNRKCDWCPNKDRETSPDNLMSWETINRLLRQLMEYQYTGGIHLFLNGEPTLDVRLPLIVRATKKYLSESYIRIVTNGDRLDSGIVEILFGVGLDSIHMNHYDGPLSEIDKKKDADFPGLSHFGMKALRPTFYNRAGKVDCVPQKQKIQCDNFLNKLIFNWKGDLILCCSDFNSEVVFGNINKQPLSIILASKKYREYYYAHREGRAKELPLCKECNLI